MLIDIAVHLDYTLPAPSDLLMQISAAATGEQTLHDPTYRFEGDPEVTHVPAGDDIGTRAWLAADDCLICDYAARVEITRTASDIPRLGATKPSDLPGPVVRYLLPSRYAPTELFKPMVDIEFAGLEGGARIAAITDFVANWMDYVPGASGVNTTAAESFVQRQGICRDYAHVAIAMLRASGIPARFVSCYDPGVEPPDFHAIAEVWTEGRWHLIDPTGMSTPETTAVIGVGLDAAETSFLTIFGTASMRAQTVSVTRAG